MIAPECIESYFELAAKAICNKKYCPLYYCFCFRASHPRTELTLAGSTTKEVWVWEHVVFMFYEHLQKIHILT